MFYLVLGLVIFISTHLVSSFRPTRNAIVAQIGEYPYKAVFSIMSLIGFIAIIYGISNSEFRPLWQPPSWGQHLTKGFMLIAFVFWAARFLPTNLKRLTHHPMLWGFIIWAIAHLISNGDLASLLFFGGLGMYSLFAMVCAIRRGDSKPARHYPLAKDIILIVLSLILYVGVMYGHPYAFGVAVN